MEAPLVRNLLLLVASLLLVAVLAFVGLEVYVRSLGIEDPEFRYENRLGMWIPDDIVGYRNRPEFVDYAWGSVLVATDARGFRTSHVGAGADSRASANDRGEVQHPQHIVGMGDSVAWGTGVDESDSYLGQLATTDSYVVTNTGVVGYSAYQELLYLQTTVLPLNPDIVLINHCENDRLPTEDPFGRAREIHVRYLERLLEAPDLSFTESERTQLRELAAIFGSAPGVWAALRDWEDRSPGSHRKFLHRVFVELPVQGMSELCRSAGVRLIYLLIPPASPGTHYAEDLTRLKAHLDQLSVEYVDLGRVLETAKGGTESRVTPFEPPKLSLATARMKELATHRALERRHRNADFIDQLHPSRRGNQKIADAVLRYLEANPQPE